VRAWASPTWRRGLGALLASTALLVLGGCATAPAPTVGATTAGAPAAAPAINPVDPWENWNRKVYGFNDAIDRAVLKPVAETYRDVVPSPVRTGVNNVLGNIRDVWSAANHLLQGKLGTSLEMGMRVLVNTTFGLGGLLDPATEMQLTKRPTDFGLTLGKWGLGSGPYVMLPLLGPSTVRDTAGTLLDRQVGPSTLPPTTGGQVAVTSVEVINARANLLSAGALLDKVALDRYSFLRDAYLSQRRNALYDGAPPMENFDDDPGDDAKPMPAPGAKPGAAPAAPAAPAKPATAATPGTTSQPK
jgi:phospholipid-binding lipoprotein MlaA